MPPIRQPTDFNYRSMLYHDLTARGGVFQRIDNRAVVMHYGDSKFEYQAAKTLAIADLSPLSRTGFRGPGTRDWLSEHGLELPDKPNTAVAALDGSVIAALSWNQFLILSDLDAKSGLCEKLNFSWKRRPALQCYPLPQADSHAWFALSGTQSPEVLAKVCGVDLRLHKFANLRLAQTTLARVNAIILRNDPGETPVFSILADSASAKYLWACLHEAMEEFGLNIVGLEALRP